MSEHELLLSRKETYLKAHQANLSRWRNNIINWDYIDEVLLKPESKDVV
jgi:hypothetical protein